MMPSTFQEKEELRRLVRRVLRESSGYYHRQYDKPLPGQVQIFRGMKIPMQSAHDAGYVRKIVRKWDASPEERDEAARLVISHFHAGSVGSSWTRDPRIALTFADAWNVSNKGKVLHVLLVGSVDPEASGYDPIAAGEEPTAYSDESEIRLPSGEPVTVLDVRVFYNDGNRGLEGESSSNSIVDDDFSMRFTA